MTLLYRSPNILIDKHEWHVVVTAQRGRASQHYRFRPVGKRAMWQHISKWPGRAPKELWRFFAPYRQSVRVAMGEKKHSRQVRHEQRLAA